MDNHALLSPSSSHRWLKCTPSAVLETEFENKSSNAAEEGTAFHALCEHKLKKALRRCSKRPVSTFNIDEIEEHSDAYVEFVLEQLEKAKQTCSDPLVLIEQKVDLSEYVPDSYGTADCLIVSEDNLHIIDAKYGLGVLVEVAENPQLMCYGIAALGVYESLYDIKEVSLSVFQPRRENVQTWTVSVEDLKAWAENELKPKAQANTVPESGASFAERQSSAVQGQQKNCVLQRKNSNALRYLRTVRLKHFSLYCRISQSGRKTSAPMLWRRQ